MPWKMHARFSHRVATARESFRALVVRSTSFLRCRSSCRSQWGGCPCCLGVCGWLAGSEVREWREEYALSSPRWSGRVRRIGPSQPIRRLILPAPTSGVETREQLLGRLTRWQIPVPVQWPDQKDQPGHDQLGHDDPDGGPDAQRGASYPTGHGAERDGPVVDQLRTHGDSAEKPLRRMAEGALEHVAYRHPGADDEPTTVSARPAPGLVSGISNPNGAAPASATSSLRAEPKRRARAVAELAPSTPLRLAPAARLPTMPGLTRISRTRDPVDGSVESRQHQPGPVTELSTDIRPAHVTCRR